MMVNLMGRASIHGRIHQEAVCICTKANLNKEGLRARAN